MDPNESDIFVGVTPMGFAEADTAELARFGAFPSREELEEMPQSALVEYAETLQKQCRILDSENKFLGWEFKEFQSSLTFFSRAAKLAHQLNASELETIVNIAINEVANYFNCGFAALFIYNIDTMRFELTRASRDGVDVTLYKEQDKFLSKLFISRSEPYIADFNQKTHCLQYEDGECFDCEIPENWMEIIGARALIFPLRVKQQDSLEPLLLGGLILGAAAGKLEGRDAEAAQFFADLLSSSLHNAQLVEKLNALTIVDPLTQIYNRRHLINQLNTAMIQARRQGHDLSIAMLDIDFFKRFNDEYGHIYGDEVLREVATVLKCGIRTGVDVPARYGGEEFILVMPFTDLDTAVEVSERIRRKIKENRVSLEDKELSVTCSFGVAQYVSGESLEKFVGRADAALYQAKKEGRDRVVAAPGE